MKAKHASALLVVLAYTANATPQDAKHVPGHDAEPAESYPVYSILIPRQLPGWHFERYAIAQQTVTKGWQIAIPDGLHLTGVRRCVVVPTDDAQEYESAISDFERKNRSSVPLQARFVLDKPYWLLNDAEVQSFRTSLAAAWGFAPKKYRRDHRFDGASALVSVSRVGFSSDGSVALVYVQHECGSLCAGGSLHVFHKQDGKWIEEKRLTCGAWDS